MEINARKVNTKEVSRKDAKAQRNLLEARQRFAPLRLCVKLLYTLRFATMKFLRPLLALALLAIVLIAVWLWWTWPTKVDMADYAPADSLVYVEFNNPAEVVQAIQHSNIWQAAAPITQSKPASHNLLSTVAARAGLGPLPGVLFARAQIALVMIGLNTFEENESLKVRPEFALIVETHTAKWRIKPAAVDAIKHLANFSYGASMCSERTADADYIECSVSGSERKIVGAVDGTLVVIGNSDNAVRSCLEARRGVRPNIHSDQEMVKVRSSVSSDKTLGFGYVSPANSAKLFSWVAPLMLLQSPGDQQLQQLLAVSAGKVLRGVAWTASQSPQGIEDRFLFSLDPGVVSRLEPAFVESGPPHDDFWGFVPAGFQSLTIYRNKEPATAWGSLSSAVALKLDAVPAALFGTLLKSSLSVYGIDNPREALTALDPPLLTLKASESAAGAILVARVNDRDRLKHSLAEEFVKGDKGEILEGLESNPNPAKEFTAVFVNEYVLLGKTENVRASLAAIRKGADADPRKYHNEGVIVTFTNDEERVNNFLSTLVQLQGRKLSAQELESLHSVVRTAGYSATETKLNALGIERTTRSAFGQFSTITSLLQSGR